MRTMLALMGGYECMPPAEKYSKIRHAHSFDHCGTGWNAGHDCVMVIMPTALLS